MDTLQNDGAKAATQGSNPGPPAVGTQGNKVKTFFHPWETLLRQEFQVLTS